jgi:alpha-glucosidase
MNIKHKTIILFLATMVLVSIGYAAEDLTCTSPDGRIGVSISTDNGLLTYRVMAGGNPVIAPSRLGMLLAAEDQKTPLTILETNKNSFDDVWTPICGKRDKVRNQYNELKLAVNVAGSVQRRMDIIFRAYDEGIAFRYVLGSEDKTPQSLTVIDDLSTLNFQNTAADIWSYRSEKRPLGPESITRIAGFRHYPLVMKATKSQWLVVTEAALHDFDNFDLEFKEGQTVANVHIDPCTVTTPFYTPWRVVMISRTPETFRDSDLLVNLSPPPTADYSWVKPGISLWDWRAWGDTTADGFTYGLEINSWRRFIDFAASNAIPYLLLDANWYGPEHSTLSDPFKGGKAAQVKDALEYGKQKGVGLLLYLNDKASVNFSIEEIAKAYADWGAVGIKYGFMKGKDQEKVRKTERVVKACSDNHLLVNFHDGPIPPTGHERTWPNWNTREYVHAQSDAKRTHSPSDFVLLAYINNIAGPVDGNHGMFDHDHSVAERPRMFQELYSTIVAEAARTLILYSGLTVIPDSPDSYREHPELFTFISSQKQPWKQSVTIAGEFGKWISTMRQAANGTYLIATATDESARTVQIPLDFMEPGKTYHATIFKDAADAHYVTNRNVYKIEQRDVSYGDDLKAFLAPGGGHCIIITSAE